jgi:hypothetical protein
MIADVIGSYLDGLQEREFDAPFVAILRAKGFKDVHFLHGSFEFGKDFIARGRESESEFQFAFQSKAGNLSLSDWGSCRSQLDLLRTNSLAHPSFNKELPRKAVFVTTGRLVGGAALAAQDYKDYLRSQGEVDIEIWDRESLVEIILGNAEVIFAGAIEGPLLALLGEVDQGKSDEKKIERMSRAWVGSADTLLGSAIIASIVANRLKQRERLDLACYSALCLVRAAWASTHGIEKPDATGLFVADTGRYLFRFYASELTTRLRNSGITPESIIWAHPAPSAHVTYPVRCLRIAEFVGLQGLLDIEEAKRDEGIGHLLVDFVRANPGVRHPISDRWAVSLIPPILLLAAMERGEDIKDWLKGVIAWVGDHYEGSGLGLAGAYSKSDEEVGYLFGGSFEHVQLPRNPTSYIAGITLDLAALLEMEEVYELARNDFLAVEASPSILEAEDTNGQYLLEGANCSLEPSMSYEDKWNPRDGWKVAPHHFRTPESYYLNRVGRPWDHLAVSAVLRDRHFLPSCRVFATRKLT